MHILQFLTDLNSSKRQLNVKNNRSNWFKSKYIWK